MRFACSTWLYHRRHVWGKKKKNRLWKDHIFYSVPGYQKLKEEHREVFVSHSQVSRQFKFVRSIFLAQLQGHWAPWLQISSESQIIVCICILIQTESFSHLKSLKWPLSGSDEHENIAAAKPQLKQAVTGTCRAASEKAFSTNTIIIISQNKTAVEMRNKGLAFAA